MTDLEDKTFQYMWEDQGQCTESVGRRKRKGVTGDGTLSSVENDGDGRWMLVKLENVRPEKKVAGCFGG